VEPVQRAIGRRFAWRMHLAGSQMLFDQQLNLSDRSGREPQLGQPLPGQFGSQLGVAEKVRRACRVDAARLGLADVVQERCQSQWQFPFIERLANGRHCQQRL